MRLALLAAAAMLTACSGNAAGPRDTDRQAAVQPIVPWSSLAFTNKSWGRPVGSWQVNADGTGYWAETKGNRFGAYSVIYHDLSVGENGVRKLALLMGDIPDPAPDPDRCDEYVTDMNYGELTFAGGLGGRTVKWNAGCRDTSYLQFLGQLMAADRLVEEWGKAAPATREEKFGEGQQ